MAATIQYPGTAEQLARHFHEVYEQLAPVYGHETREESRTKWDQVPDKNRRLMIAVCATLMGLDPE